jgi:hypothetical protein
MTNNSNSIRIIYATLDDKQIAYTNQTEFLVQIGKGKGSYSTRYSFIGELSKAVLYYKSINIGNGYKKRLFVPSFNRKVLAKYCS